MCSPSCMGQNKNEGNALVEKFNNRFKELDSLILCIPLTRQIDTVAERKADVIFKAGNIALNEKLEAEVNHLKSQTGLEINAHVYCRATAGNMGVGIDEDDVLLSMGEYIGKIQAELAWNFFNSSFYKRKGKTNELYIRNQIEQIDYEHENILLSINRQKEVFRVEYDSLLAGILLHRIYNLTLIDNAQEYLLRTENTSSDELLEILNEKAQAERSLAIISREYLPAQDLSMPNGVIIEIDTAELMQQIRNTYVDFAKLDLQKDLLEQKYQNTDYLQDMSMTPFARYSCYTYLTNPNVSNIDAGLRFKLPLSIEQKRKKQEIQAQKNVVAVKREQLEKRVVENVRLILLEIERMNRSSIGEMQRLKNLKNYLSVRKKAYDNKIGEYSLLSRIKEYNTYLSCWEKLLYSCYRRNCLLIDLQAYLRYTSIISYCKEIEL